MGMQLRHKRALATIILWTVWATVGQEPQSRCHSEAESQCRWKTTTNIRSFRSIRIVFPIPSVGVQIPNVQSHGVQKQTPISDSSVGTANQMQASRPDATNKSIKTQLHQKANKIGKLESRMERLQKALAEIQVTWPQFVHELRQVLVQEHQKVVNFQTAVTQELQQLKAEHHVLLHQQLVPMPSVHNPAIASMEQDKTSQIQAALELLAAHGIQPGNTYANTHVPMQVDATTHAAHQHVAMSHGGFGTDQIHAQPSSQFVQQHPAAEHISVPTLPVQTEAIAPAGNWQWPPAMPTRPELRLPDISIAEEPAAAEEQDYATLLQQQQAALQQPIQPPAAMSPNHTQRLDNLHLDQELMVTVNQAAQALNQLPPEQGGGGGQGLTEAHMSKLIQFAQLQQQCQMQLHALKQDMIPTAAAHTDSAHTKQNQQQQPYEPDIPIPSPVHTPLETQQRASTAPATPQAADAMSIHSSPAKTAQQQGSQNVYSLSPRGQRQVKIPKQVPGNVHAQPNTAVQTPISPASSHTPTPVPTEIPSEEEDGLDGLG